MLVNISILMILPELSIYGMNNVIVILLSPFFSFFATQVSRIFLVLSIIHLIILQECEWNIVVSMDSFQMMNIHKWILWFEIYFCQNWKNCFRRLEALWCHVWEVCRFVTPWDEGWGSKKLDKIMWCLLWTILSSTF